MTRTYCKFMDKVALAEKIFLAITSALLVAVVMYQVVLRYCFTASNAWSEELARYLFIYDTLIGSALAIQRHSHLQVDFFLNAMKPRVKCWFTIGSTLIGMVFLVFLFCYSLTLCRASLTNISAGLGISMAIPYTCIPIGSVLMLLASVEVILRTAGELRAMKGGEGA